ncbi:MAG: hypothetical protein VKP72_03965 [bacterium]|nr:hypothetical protein [bacterium]
MRIPGSGQIAARRRPVHALTAWLGLSSLLTGCITAATSPSAFSGRVVFPVAARSTQATVIDVGQAATVSVIDPVSSKTVATSLTSADGSFAFSFRTGAPVPGVYLLEAVKGLSGNRAGMDAARLRTVIRRNPSGSPTEWQSLTRDGLFITPETTAIAAILSLQGLTVEPVIEKLTVIPGIQFDPAGTGVSPEALSAVTALVNQALGQDRDPLSALSFDGATYRYGTLTPPYLSSVAPNPLRPGESAILSGGGFTSPATSQTVTLNGLACTVTALSGNQLTITVPLNARSGTLTVSHASGQASLNVSVLEPLNGVHAPESTVSAPASGNGLALVGSLFGR